MFDSSLECSCKLEISFSDSKNGKTKLVLYINPCHSESINRNEIIKIPALSQQTFTDF